MIEEEAQDHQKEISWEKFSIGGPGNHPTEYPRHETG
jgi:hypothetical protein